MESNTNIETIVQDDIGIINIEGEVTSYSEKALQEAYKQLTDQGLKKIGLNFEKVSYINSAGMAIIINLLTKSRKSGQTLCSWGLTDHYRKIFDMVGITRYMEVYKNQREALKGF